MVVYKLENVVYDDKRKEELLKILRMIYAKDEAERFEIAKGSEKVENIARKDEKIIRSKEIAKNLLNLNIDISAIMKSTGLSRQDILKLQEN